MFYFFLSLFYDPFCLRLRPFSFFFLVSSSFYDADGRKLQCNQQIIESTDLIPITGDIAKTTRHAEEFRDLHESLQKKLTMDALAGAHRRVKASMVADATKQTVCQSLFVSFISKINKIDASIDHFSFSKDTG